MKTRHTLVTALLCAAATVAHAQDVKQQARNAAIADTATTAIGLAAGAAEANPLGVLTIPLKVAILHSIDNQPDEGQRAVSHAMVASVWSGAAANNLCVVAAIASGGAFAPVCLAVGIGWGAHTWKQTENERIFWTEACPTLRAYAQMPELKCVYTAPAPTAQSVAAAVRQDALD